MSSSRITLALTALALAVLEGCGGATSAPVATKAPSHEPAISTPADLSPNVMRDRRAEPGVRAAARPLVIGKPASVKCGGLTKSSSDAEMTDLLGGRLRVRPSPGARVPPAQADAPPLFEESRVILEPGSSGSKKDKGHASLAIVARETFQLDPDLYEAEQNAPMHPGSLDVEAPKFLQATFGHASGEEPLEIVPVELTAGATKMRAYAARPPHPNAPPGKDTALVLALLVAQDDGALESVAFYVRGELVRNATADDLVGCTRLAERLASTIVPGPRKLERAAGKRNVAAGSPDGELALTVPADYVVVPMAERGAHIYKLRPLSLYAGSISVAIVDKAERKVPDGADATVTGKLLGRPTEWRGKTTPKGGFFFAAEPLDSGNRRTAEVLVKATRQAKALDEMRGVAETLAIVKR